MRLCYGYGYDFDYLVRLQLRPRLRHVRLVLSFRKRWDETINR